MNIGAGIGGGSGGKCPHTFYELSIGISFFQYKCGLLQYVCPHTFDQLPALLNEFCGSEKVCFVFPGESISVMISTPSSIMISIPNKLQCGFLCGRVSITTVYILKKHSIGETPSQYPLYILVKGSLLIVRIMFTITCQHIAVSFWSVKKQRNFN